MDSLSPFAIVGGEGCIAAFIAQPEDICSHPGAFGQWNIIKNWNLAQETSLFVLATRCQAWLYLGLLKTLLGDVYKMDVFVSGGVVSAAHLHSTMERSTLERCHVVSALQTAISAFEEIIVPTVVKIGQSDDPTVDWNSTPYRVLFSTAMLLEELYLYLREHLTTESALPQPSSIFVIETLGVSKALKAIGRCPSLLSRFTLPAHIANSLLSSAVLQTDIKHDECTTSHCKMFNVNEKKYIPQHEQHCTGKLCAMRGFNYQSICTIIDKGAIPLVRSLSDGHKTLDLELVEGTLDSSYTAISHVWAGGLGNFEENQMYECQLRQIHHDLDRVPGGFSLNPFVGIKADYDAIKIGDTSPPRRPSALGDTKKTTHLYWIDTLCIAICPNAMRRGQASVDHSRRTAIDSMASMYAGAQNVLVLDPELRLDIASQMSPTEISLAVACSPWQARTWTLLEGALATKLLFKFCDGIKRASDVHKLPFLDDSLVGTMWTRDLLDESHPELPVSMMPFVVQNFSRPRDDFAVITVRPRHPWLRKLLPILNAFWKLFFAFKSTRMTVLQLKMLIQHPMILSTLLAAGFYGVYLHRDKHNCREDVKTSLAMTKSSTTRDSGQGASRISIKQRARARFVQSWNELTCRSTTKPEDAAAVLAALLYSSSGEVLAFRDPRDRMKALLKSQLTLPMAVLMASPIASLRISSSEQDMEVKAKGFLISDPPWLELYELKDSSKLLQGDFIAYTTEHNHQFSISFKDKSSLNTASLARERIFLWLRYMRNPNGQRQGRAFKVQLEAHDGFHVVMDDLFDWKPINNLTAPHPTASLDHVRLDPIPRKSLFVDVDIRSWPDLQWSRNTAFPFVQLALGQGRTMDMLPYLAIISWCIPLSYHVACVPRFLALTQNETTSPVVKKLYAESTRFTFALRAILPPLILALARFTFATVEYAYICEVEKKWVKRTWATSFQNLDTLTYRRSAENGPQHPATALCVVFEWFRSTCLWWRRKPAVNLQQNTAEAALKKAQPDFVHVFLLLHGIICLASTFACITCGLYYSKLPTDLYTFSLGQNRVDVLCTPVQLTGQNIAIECMQVGQQPIANTNLNCADDSCWLDPESLNPIVLTLTRNLPLATAGMFFVALAIECLLRSFIGVLYLRRWRIIARNRHVGHHQNFTAEGLTTTHLIVRGISWLSGIGKSLVDGRNFSSEGSGANYIIVGNPPILKGSDYRELPQLDRQRNAWTNEDPSANVNCRVSGNALAPEEEKPKRTLTLTDEQHNKHTFNAQIFGQDNVNARCQCAITDVDTGATWTMKTEGSPNEEKQQLVSLEDVLFTLMTSDSASVILEHCKLSLATNISV